MIHGGRKCSPNFIHQSKNVSYQKTSKVSKVSAVDGWYIMHVSYCICFYPVTHFYVCLFTHSKCFSSKQVSHACDNSLITNQHQLFNELTALIIDCFIQRSIKISNYQAFNSAKQFTSMALKRCHDDIKTSRHEPVVLIRSRVQMQALWLAYSMNWIIFQFEVVNILVILV
jgi:hypothetical protein